MMEDAKNEIPQDIVNMGLMVLENEKGEIGEITSCLNQSFSPEGVSNSFYMEYPNGEVFKVTIRHEQV